MFLWLGATTEARLYRKATSLARRMEGAIEAARRPRASGVQSNEPASAPCASQAARTGANERR